MSSYLANPACETDRPVPWKMRGDLQASKQMYQGKEYWVLKDPLALAYFRFAEEEYALLKLLDGRRTLGEIQQAFEKSYLSQQVTLDELKLFIANLEQQGLLTGGPPGQGKKLYERGQAKQTQAKLGAAFNPLAVRFPGIDPERFLQAAYPWIRGVFHPVCMACALLLILSAALLITVEFHVFQAKLPDLQRFFTPENIGWLAVMLAATKVLHELGHAFTAKHFGGECHEMGVMLLMFTPCLYCNVSDTWMSRNKWQRAAVAAAGMVVELTMAAAATWLWWFSQPGLFNHLCLNVMFIGGVNAVLLNGNPLLRYDGYYILSDLLEIPNLRQKASETLKRLLGTWMLGLPATPDPFLPQRQRWAFAVYAVASGVYRWFITFSILWF